MRQPSFALAPLTLASLLAAGLSGVAHSQPKAADAPVAITIAAQPLGAALNELARQAGFQLLFPPALVAGKTAPAFSGRLTPHQAVARLLAGSGLMATQEGNAVVIKAAPLPSETSALPPVVVTASADSVLTESTGSYTARSTNSSTGLELSLRETPQSVTVITSQQILDRGFASITNALENASGLYKINDFARPSFTSRGFDVSNFSVDGSPMQPGSRAMSDLQLTNTVAYDSITVVRGANGLLTGTGDPSASVNLVRKRATRHFQGHVNAAAGSWNNKVLEADLSGPLNSAGTMRGRIAAGGSDADYFIDHKGSTVKTVFATVEADLTPNTVARIGYHLDDSGLKGMSAESSGPLFYSDGSPTKLPVSWGDTPRIWSQNQNARTAFLGLEHGFGNGWQFDGLVNYAKQSRMGPQVIKLTSANAYPHPDGSWAQNLHDYTPTPIRDEQWSYNLTLKGPLQLFGREHEIVTGLAGWKLDRKWYEVSLADYTLPSGFLGAGLWNVGEYGFVVGSRMLGASSNGHTEQHGGLLAARWNLVDTVKLITGARLTSWKTRVDNYDAETGAFVDTSGAYKVSTQLTPYVGATWDFHPNLTAYASYTDVFAPQNYYDRNDNVLEPVVGKSYEIGMKGQFFDKRLNASAALFRALRDNLAIIDPAFGVDYLTPGGNRPHISAGKGNKATGIDLEVSGALTDRWNIASGYAYASLKGARGGKVDPNTPEQVLRLFTTYRLGGASKGLTLGGGVNWHSSIERNVQRPTGAYQADGAPVTSDYNFRQSGVTLVNAMVRYDATADLSFSLNVDNLLDKKYFSSISPFRAYGVYGTPRQVRVGARYQF